MNNQEPYLTYEDIKSSLSSNTSSEISQKLYDIVGKNIERGRFKRFLQKNTVTSLQEYILRVHQFYESNCDIVQEIKINKNKDAWQDFLNTLYSWAYCFLEKWALDKDIQKSYTQVVAQRASVAILESYFPYDCDFNAWACIIVHHTGSKFMQTINKQTSVVNDEYGDLSEIEEWGVHSSLTHNNLIDFKETAEDIYTAIQKLSPIQQTLIQSYYFEGKSFAEIASEGGASINTVYKRHFDSLAQLRKIFYDTSINE